MIRYELKCAAGHEFEGWFANASGFDVQRDGGFLNCPICGSSHVEKALMTPALTRRSAPPLENLEPAPASTANPETDKPDDTSSLAPTVWPARTASNGTRETFKGLRRLRTEMLRNSEDVGSRFAEMARQMHYGEAPRRAVHGQTTTADAKALVEEGVPICPIPTLPEDLN